jgi:hypothetical protein
VVRPEAPGDGAVRPWHEHDLGVGQVGELGPVTLLGEEGHPQHQRVHAGEDPPGRPEDTRDVRDQGLGGQLPGQGPVFGDHAVSAAVGQE